MGSSKWRKHIDSDIASFRRPRGSAQPGRSILIVTEGEVTEPVYFETLRRKLALQTVEIEVVPAGKGDPRRLAEVAVETKEKRRKAAKDGKIGSFQAPDFDELWIVFDSDVPVEHGRYHGGVAFAQSRKVNCAQSTPCFEYWLLLHREYTTAPMPKFADVKPRLKAYLGGSYEKDCKKSAKKIPPLLKDLDTAMENAEKARKHHHGAGTPAPANSSTDVDLLVIAIDETTAPAHKRKSRNLPEK